MPERREALYDASAAMWLKEEDAKLYKVRAFDGLAGMQIVREWKQPGNGIAIGQIDHLLMKMDYSADADTGATASRDCGKQGALRYVANPSVGGRQFAGLYAGGPVELVWTGEKQEYRVFRQTLTRVRCAGHGWRFDTATKRVVIEAAGSSDSGSSDSVDGEEATVLESLKKCRPAVIRAGKALAAYRTDKGKRVVTEMRFRDFTHESIPFFEAMSAADAVTVAQYHLGVASDMVVDALRPEIDPETNTVVLTLAMQELVVNTVTAVGDLATIPHRLMPATRETLRKFGMKSEDEGEGYLFGKLYRWENLSRSSETILQYPADLTFLAAVVDAVASYTAWSASGTSGAICSYDGRLWQYTGSGSGSTFAEKLASGGLRPWWRVVEYRLEEQEDGLLSFTAHVQKPLWNGGNTAEVTSLENPNGWGRGRVDTVPSVPQAMAESLAGAATAPTGYVLGGVAVSEQSPGVADLKKNLARVWDYSTDAPAMADSAPVVTRRVVGPGDGGMSVSFPRVALASAAAVKTLAEGLVVPDANHFLDGATVQTDPDGGVKIEAQSTREAPHTLASHQAEGDYFETTDREMLFNQAPATIAAGLQEDHTIIDVAKSKTTHGLHDVAKTVETPVARDWATTHVVDALDGTERTVTVHHYRNAAAKPEQPELAAGWRWSENFTMNRFGLWDGEATIAPHDIEWAGMRGSVDYFGSSTATMLHNRATADATAAAQSVNALTSVQRSETASGLHDSTVTAETGIPRDWTNVFLPDALGVATRTVSEHIYRNQTAEPADPTPATGRRVAKSVTINRLGSIDAEITESPDDREKQSVTEEEDAFTEKVSTAIRNAAAASEAVAGLNASTGVLTRVTKSETLSGLHDSVVSVETPKADYFTFSFAVKSRGRTGTVTVHVYVNQAEIQVPTLSSGYEARASWNKNQFGLYDGHVSHSPTFYTEVSGTISEQWVQSKSWVERTNKTTQTDTPPVDGYYWRKVVESSSWQITTDNSSAASFAAAGKQGSYSDRVRDGLYIAKKVTSLTFGSWSSAAQSGV